MGGFVLPIFNRVIMDGHPISTIKILDAHPQYDTIEDGQNKTPRCLFSYSQK